MTNTEIIEELKNNLVDEGKLRCTLTRDASGEWTETYERIRTKTQWKKEGFEPVGEPVGITNLWIRRKSDGAFYKKKAYFYTESSVRKIAKV